MRKLITVSTDKYTRTHGHAPRHRLAMQYKGMWAFQIDDEPQVQVKYGTWSEALRWAKEKALTRVEVLP